MSYTIGVLMPKPYQLLDAAGAIEIFGMVGFSVVKSLVCR
jgi:hypothetical protein